MVEEHDEPVAADEFDAALRGTDLDGYTLIASIETDESLEEILAAMDDDREAAEEAAARLLLGRLDPAAFLEVVKPESVSHDNDAWFHIGLHHERAGRQDEAREAYAKSVAATLGENFPVLQARQALARLEAEK